MDDAQQGSTAVPLFTYGGYMDCKNLQRKDVKPLRSVIGVLPAHEVAVAKRHPLQFTLRPARDDGVHGVIHYLSPEDGDKLYRDGEHDHYAQRKVQARELASGEMVECACFLAPARDSLSILSRYDLEPIVVAAMAVGLEEFYVRKLFSKCKGW